MTVAADHEGPWTIDDVMALGEDRRYRHELLDGVLMMSPAPGVAHQRSSRVLANLLDNAARAAGVDVEVLEAINVVLPSGLFIPDIAVVDAAVTADDPVSVDADAVLFVVEIVSPSTKHLDRRAKPAVYAEAGVPGYWRLEFHPVPVLVVAELVAGSYVETAVASVGVTTVLPAPFPLAIDVAALIRRR